MQVMHLGNVRPLCFRFGLLVLCSIFVFAWRIDSYFSRMEHIAFQHATRTETLRKMTASSARSEDINESKTSAREKSSWRERILAVAGNNLKKAIDTTEFTLKTKEKIREKTNETIQLCVSWSPYQWNSSKEIPPQIKLDPDRFLYPGLVWGPNNQIVGFWQSIYLAIRLNRTLVIPSFVAHFSTGGGSILAEHRIDVGKIRSFVSSISIESLHETCNGTFDVALQAMDTDSRHIQAFEKDTGMKILYSNSSIKSNNATTLRLTDLDRIKLPTIPTLPAKEYKLTYDPWLQSDINSLRKAYDTDARCAIYVAPFNAIHTKLANGIAFPLQSPNINANNVSDTDLFSAVVDVVRHPPCIVDAARRFIQEIFDGEKFVALHWRYDVGDWRKQRCGPRSKSSYAQMCKDLERITPADVANSIASNICQTNNLSKELWIRVYVAAPPSMEHFKVKLHAALKIINDDFKPARKTLTSFLNDKFKSCWTAAGWTNIGEIVSEVEMEIMALSEWFFHSPGSTWSSNVRPLRVKSGKVRKHEASVFDLARAEMLKRVNNPTKPEIEGDFSLKENPEVKKEIKRTNIIKALFTGVAPEKPA